MDRPEVETALLAANAALNGRKRREAKSFASIELRAERPKDEHWEILAAGAIGFVAIGFVVAAWLF
jgi:hypothetical protein